MRRFVVIMFAFVLAACGGTRRNTDFGGGGQLSKVVVLERALDAQRELDAGALAFDLRDFTAWMQGHLPGARSITLDDLRQLRGLPDDKNVPLMFYGEGKLDDRAEDAAEHAAALGFRHVMYFPGGWRAWSGQPAVD